MIPTLYDHQTEQVSALRAELVNGPSILSANPGVGKTRMAKHIMAKSANREQLDGFSGSAVFAVHRRGLVDNASDSFNEEPRLPHGLIMSGRDTDWRHSVQVASIDTLVSWYVGDKYESKHTFDLVVYDECHSHLSKLKKWLESHDAKRAELGLRPACVIGLSATPEAKGMADVFKSIVTGKTTDWLIENGYLSPFVYLQGTQGKLDKLVKRGNEFTADSLDAAFAKLDGELVRDWLSNGQGRPTVGFFSRLSHAKEAMHRLREAGVMAEYVDGSTPDQQRKRLFSDLGDGSIDYLCNVGIVERGTNIPRIECVQLCTSIGSVVRFKQMVGRGSRTALGKKDCLVIDHGGNIRRHGFFEDEIEWTLDNSKSAVKNHEAKPTIYCPQCKRVYRGGTCSACGYSPTVQERKSQGLTFSGSKLVPVTRKERTKKLKTNEEILVNALYACGRSGRTWRQAYGMASGMAKRQGTKFKCPANFKVGANEYQALSWNDPNTNRRLKDVFEFLQR